MLVDMKNLKHNLKKYEKLLYDTILGMDCLKSTNPVINLVVCSLELTVGAN